MAAKEVYVEAWCLTLPLGGVREFRFAPPRRWRFDIAYEKEKVAVEIHGGVWQQGRHTRGRGFLADREKMNEAALLGWLVLEVGYEHLENGAAREWLLRALALRRKEEQDVTDVSAVQ